jgi:hypothetical protein
MSVSKSTKTNTKKASKLFKQSSSALGLQRDVAALKDAAPVYSNSYANQLGALYSKIKDGSVPAYSPENDAAYRRFADEYRALGAIAAAQSLAQAQGLTGGYGSTYAPEVAAGAIQSAQAIAESAEPMFARLDRSAQIAADEVLKNMFEAAKTASADELADYGEWAKAYRNQLDLAVKRYADQNSFDYDKYKANREFWDKQYQNELAGEKEEQKLELKKIKAENSGSSGRSGSSGGSSRSGSSKSSSKSKSKDNGKADPLAKWSPNMNIVKFINLNNRSNDFNTAVKWIDYLIKKKRLDKEEKLLYVYYFRNALK